MSDERRGSPRLAKHLAGELETDEGASSIAITRDVGARGLLVYTRIRLAPGTPVKFTVVFEDRQLQLVGTVLREEAVEPDTSSLWHSKVAIEIPEDPILAQIYAALGDTN